MTDIRIIGSEGEKIGHIIKCYVDNTLIITERINKTSLPILTFDAEPPFSTGRILLMPDTPIAIPESRVAVSYGMSSRCTVTLSSIGDTSILALQRKLTTVSGNILEPQEIRISNPHKLSQYGLMACDAALLILGVSPDKLA